MKDLSKNFYKKTWKSKKSSLPSNPVVHKKIDIVDKIEKEIKLKNCKICKQNKKLSKFSKVNKGKYHNSYCKSCATKKQKDWRKDNPTYMKQYKKDNPEKQQYYNKSSKKKLADKKLHNSIPSGIYGIYENTQLIYIGESNKPYKRKTDHFSNSLETNNSVIAQAIGRGELYHENLSFEMLEYVDDEFTRKQREKTLIQRYKPEYNNLYVNA